jgi:hypothetical protein
LACTVTTAIAATLFTEPAEAQGRRAVRHVAPRGVVVAGYYRPLFYDPFFYDPWFAYPFGWYPPYGYPPYAYGPVYFNSAASLRLQVSPRETEVFIDNYYAGTVDGFDGFFQRMHLEPGEHEVTFYHSGYRTVKQKILLQPGKTFRVRHMMEALPAGAPPEPRPIAAAPPPPSTEAPGRSDAPSQPAGGAGNTAFGAIAIRVQPADADVLINGDRWEGPASDEALVVQLAPGRYDIEVRKDGYRPYVTQIEVRSGQTAPLNVSLPQQ